MDKDLDEAVIFPSQISIQKEYPGSRCLGTRTLISSRCHKKILKISKMRHSTLVKHLVRYVS